MQPPAILATRLARRNLAPRRFRSNDVTRDLRAMMDDPLKTEARDPAFMGFVDRQFRRVFGEDPAARDATGRLVQPRPKRDDLEVFRPALRRDDTRLRGGVGRGQENDPGDVGRAQRLLSNAGTFDLAIPRERSGAPSGALFDGIAAFQVQAGLRPDGVMRPGGPTVAALDRGLGVGALTRAAQQPPDDGFRPAPPEDGGQQLPPDDGFRPQPPAEGGTQQPPDDGFRPLPPDDGASPIPGSKPPQQPPDDGSRPLPGVGNDPDGDEDEEEEEEEEEEDEKPEEECERIRAELKRAKADVKAFTADVERDLREISEIEKQAQRMKAEAERLLLEVGAKSLLDILKRAIPVIRVLQLIIDISNVIQSMTLKGRAMQLKERLEFLNKQLRSNKRKLEAAKAEVEELRRRLMSKCNGGSEGVPMA